MQLPVYSSFEEKGFAFSQGHKSILNDDVLDTKPQILINTKDEFDWFYNAYNKNKSLIYRGVNEAKYKLYTSIQRSFIEGRINSNETISSFVRKEIDSLKNNEILNNYYKVLGLPVTDFLYLSFLQHYTAPTPFLDFSHKLDVALFFASEGVKYGNGIGNPSIDEYFSIYWVDTKENGDFLFNIPEYFKSLYIDVVHSLNNHAEVKRDGVDVNLYKYLSWEGNDHQGISSIALGFLDSDNKTRHFPIGDLRTASSLIRNNINRFLKTNSKTSILAVEKVISNYFDEVIKIVNLNLIAQEGCFIQYVPDNVDLQEPLENYFKSMKGLIHCADIHKSLVPYIKNILSHNKITFETIYPEPKKIANEAMEVCLLNL